MRWRRTLTNLLGLLWMLDAALQFQPYMFSLAFPRDVIAPAAAGSPAWVAGPVRWVATITGEHVVAYNAVFATAQLCIAIGLFVAVTRRVALFATVLWSLLVWWLAEGLGGILAGPASPIAGFPGAVVIYALVAVALWPPRPRPTRDARRRSVADMGLLGARGARLVWVCLWAAFAYEAIRSAGRPSSGFAATIREMAAGEPGWIASGNLALAASLGHHEIVYSMALATVFALVGASVFAPRFARAGVIAAAVVSLGMWVVGEDLGGIATGTSTDPNSGLPLALLALCYWPLRTMYPMRRPDASVPLAAQR